MTNINYGLCSECGGSIYVDVTAHNRGYRCRKCKIYDEDSTIKNGIRDMSNGLKWKGKI